VKFYITHLIIFFLALFSSLNADLKEDLEINKNEILVGFYGRPNSRSLGVLGENNINTLISKMKKKQAYFEDNIGENVTVKMAFHIIHSLATKDPGRRNDYLLNIPEKSILKYINSALKENFEVILDVQLGVKTVNEAIQPLLKYLKYDNVHIAIDPEFKIPKHRRYPPGKFIGHIYASELNKAQESISSYLTINKLEGKRKLIVHMFKHKMLRKKEDVKIFDNIQLVYNIDGHGSKHSKVQIYNSLYSKKVSAKAISGFKIFYKTDKKPLMTPKQILGLAFVGKRKISIQPYYINYH
jgi:hypothetical protein